MRWMLVVAFVLTAGCGAMLAPEPRVDEGLDKFYGDTIPEADEKMYEMQVEERTTSGLDDVYEELERDYAAQ